MIKNQNNQKGFTLLETLVAISIVTLTIVGPLAMAAQSSRLISVAKSQLIATYLAQEAMELVRYQRDTNMIEEVEFGSAIYGVDWLRGGYPIALDGSYTLPNTKLGNCMDSGENACYVDWGPSFVSCADVNAFCSSPDPTTNKASLWKHERDGYVVKGSYPASELTQTSFKRYIQIIPIIVNVDEEIGAKVIVKVTWKDTYGDKTLYTQENIYKYR